MTKLLPAVAAVAALGLGTAALAQTAPGPSATPRPGAQTPSGTTDSQTGTPSNRPGAADTRSGAATGTPVTSEAEARAMLQKEGYANVTDVKRQGQDFQAKAMKNGKQVTVNIDGKTGRVSTR